MAQPGVYRLSEDDILQFSKMVTAFEESVKALIRRRGRTDDDFASLEEIEFWRQASMASSRDDDDGPLGAVDAEGDIDA
jgi:hypothetical protein